MLLQGLASAQTKLEEGDLLFCIAKENNNITDVTQGVSEAKIDHVAILHWQNGKAFALEAIHKGVVLTPLDSFLCRNDSMVAVGRLRDTTGVAASVKRAMSFVGRPYDFLFMPGNDAFYCSELVQTNYLDKCGKPVFAPIPMSFHDKTGKVTTFWKEYYSKRNQEVPEGKPGSNPGNLSQSDKIRIVYWFKTKNKQRKLTGRKASDNDT